MWSSGPGQRAVHWENERHWGKRHSPWVTMPAATSANFTTLSLRNDHLSIHVCVCVVCACACVRACSARPSHFTHGAHGCHNSSSDADSVITATVLWRSQTWQEEQQRTSQQRHQRVFTHTREYSTSLLPPRFKPLLSQAAFSSSFRKGNGKVTTLATLLWSVWQIKHRQTATEICLTKTTFITQSSFRIYKLLQP